MWLRELRSLSLPSAEISCSGWALLYQVRPGVGFFRAIIIWRTAGRSKYGIQRRAITLGCSLLMALVHRRSYTPSSLSSVSDLDHEPHLWLSAPKCIFFPPFFALFSHFKFTLQRVCVLAWVMCWYSGWRGPLRWITCCAEMVPFTVCCTN